MANIDYRYPTWPTLPQKGVIVPDYIGKDEACVNFILRKLRERGIIYEERIEEMVA